MGGGEPTAADEALGDEAGAIAVGVALAGDVGASAATVVDALDDDAGAIGACAGHPVVSAHATAVARTVAAVPAKESRFTMRPDVARGGGEGQP